MFKERLKELRQQKGISQKELASIIGVETSTIGKYEGKGNIMPSDDVKTRIADYFNVSIDYLMGRTYNPIQPDAAPEIQGLSEVCNLYRCLNAQGRALVQDYIRMLASNPVYSEDTSLAKAI